MSNPLIYRARIKELAKTMEMRVSEDAVVATDAKVRAMVQEAAKRAKTHNPTPIPPQDLSAAVRPTEGFNHVGRARPGPPLFLFNG